MNPVLVASAHGTGSPAGRRAVGALVAAVARARPELEVRAAFVDVQPPEPSHVLAGLDGRPARLVPLLLSAGYHVYVDLTEAAAGSPGTTLCGALGPDPRLAALLRDRLVEAGLRDDDVVVMAAAGSSQRSAVADCERVAADLSSLLGRPVTPAYLSAAEPTVADAVAAARVPGRRVAVATYLLAPGFFADRAARAGGDLTSGPLLPPHGEPPPALVDIVVERYGSG
ncbi:sirohydrochlorin chelatase [Terracoccus luteus]|uniref:Sirohydrochlorin ferrochelatase n=1 Tax=Terracoccus luteus TaxID=53356 RepID=A0A839PUE8_9MICO|nr:CbiX/SirB N-terminal domain-containing protein [Terracoccus luteus]MBB2985665.1 sirohydrochlorin ferrochelatase [Terracoccus luteus]MCP2171317.1 sirohydrochlorin ferrochelatase [Terracoccus luteus]